MMIVVDARSSQGVLRLGMGGFVSGVNGFSKFGLDLMPSPICSSYLLGVFPCHFAAIILDVFDIF